MSAMPAVSVIMPVLNAEAHLAEAIGSVTAQTVPDFELILVDDGSTDGSRAIAEAAAAADPRIRLVVRGPEDPHGPGPARNAGIAAARGDFVAFLDADDRFERHMLAETLAAMKAHPEVAMVYGPTCWWYPDGSRPDWTEQTDGRAGRVHRPPSLLTAVLLLQDGHVPCVCSVLIRRSAVAEHGGFEEAFRLYEDQALWVKVFLRHPVYITGRTLSRYRQHAGSASAQATGAGVYDRRRGHPARAVFLDWTARHVAESGVRSPVLAAVLRLARAPYGGTAFERLSFRLLQAALRRRRRWLRMAGRALRR